MCLKDTRIWSGSTAKNDKQREHEHNEQRRNDNFFTLHLKKFESQTTNEAYARGRLPKLALVAEKKLGSGTILFDKNQTLSFSFAFIVQINKKPTLNDFPLTFHLNR